MTFQTRLFVGNLPEKANESELRTVFSAYGDITNVDLKQKTAENEAKKFAFITLTASNYEVESCIKYFSSADFQGNRLYVTRARESFLERLQRERQQAQEKETQKIDQNEHLPNKIPEIKLSEKLNPRKRKFDQNNCFDKTNKSHASNKIFIKPSVSIEIKNTEYHNDHAIVESQLNGNLTEADKKKIDSDKKRLESLKKKRQDFKQKKMIIKTGLVCIDKAPNKKTIFSDNEEALSENSSANHIKQPTKINIKKANTLFEDDDSDDEVNFEIKKQFEGKEGQKVLDLQSRYKSDKRFILDERFIDNEQDKEEATDEVDVSQVDEKAKQLSILQDVLGVEIKTYNANNPTNKKKSKIGMLRFDPTQPEHVKFLAPVVSTNTEVTKKSKNKKQKNKQEEEKPESDKVEEEKVLASKEQFYKITDTLKEALTQPAEFSLRSLFGRNEEDNSVKVQDSGHIPLTTTKEPKVKNPFDHGKKNPFKYDSSDSEGEESKNEIKGNTLTESQQVKAVWRENLFFSDDDNRFIEGLSFFNERTHEPSKERRELKSLMKKRIYNKERKNKMFQKKIGGKKKSLKKSYRKKSGCYK